MPIVDEADIEALQEALIAGLTEQESFVIRARFLNPGSPRTLDEVAALLELTAEELSLIEERAMALLNKRREAPTTTGPRRAGRRKSQWGEG